MDRGAPAPRGGTSVELHFGPDLNIKKGHHFIFKGYGLRKFSKKIFGLRMVIRNYFLHLLLEPTLSVCNAFIIVQNKYKDLTF